MELLIAVSVFLVLLVIGLSLYLLAVKHQLRGIKEELKRTRQQDYNKQLSITLFDRDVTALSTEINQNLDFQKHVKLTNEQAEKRIRQSISDIAHDLRTPLTVIKGNLQMLKHRTSLTGQEQAYLNVCQEKADLLRDMIDDFFEMSVLESDSAPVSLCPVDLTDLLVKFVIDHEAVIREKGLEPGIVLPEKSVMVSAEEQLLCRMLGNLLNNVLKYAKESFSISLEEGAGDCQIVFANAVPPEAVLDVEHLFDRSYRADGARQSKGAGLGLYIVKLLAEKQDARVFAQRVGNELRIGIIFREI